MTQDDRAAEPGVGPVHIPVLVREVLHYLNVRATGTYLDGTVGDGGHARAILEAGGPQTQLVGCDLDPASLEGGRAALAGHEDQVRLVQASYDSLQELACLTPEGAFAGILLDLGFSTRQMEAGERGFSFARAGPLDMRYDPSSSRPASDLLARMGETDLADLIYSLGEDRFARRIARAIVRRRKEKPIKVTTDLADIVMSAVPRRRWRIHPATRTFQALRIAVNGELETVERALAELPGALETGGRAVVISFHSLEDRRVKHAFRAGKADGTYRILTPKPVTAQDAEVAENPASRSAKLRAVERL